MDASVLANAGVSAQVIAVLLLVAAAAKAIYALKVDGRRNRKECLELWDPQRAGDDYWLESYVNLRYSERSPPADLVRQCLAVTDSTRRLNDLVLYWQFFTGRSIVELQWKLRFRNHKGWRIAEAIVWLLAYPAAITAGVLFFYWGGPDGWVPALALLAVGAGCFWTFLMLRGAADAEQALKNAMPAPKRAVA